MSNDQAYSRQGAPAAGPSRVTGSGSGASSRHQAPQRRSKKDVRQLGKQREEQPEYTTEESDDAAADHAALIDARFHRAVDIIQSLPKAGPITTTYEEKLGLYSYYKQATEGAVKIPRPSILDLLGRAKWDAWKKREKLTPQEAQQAYVDTLLGILKGFSDRTEAIKLINELKNFGTDAEEYTDEFESVSSSQRSYSPPSTSKRTFHSAVRSSLDDRNSLQGDITPKRRPTRQKQQAVRGEEAYTDSEDDERHLSDNGSDKAPLANTRPARRPSYGRETDAEEHLPVRRPSPYHHPAQYPAPVASQLPPNLPRNALPEHRLSSRDALRPEQGRVSAVPSVSGLPPDFNADLQSVRSRQSSANNDLPLRVVQAKGHDGASASLPTLPSQSAGVAITARQANLDRALDSIQTSLAALHERLNLIESTQYKQSKQLDESARPSYFSNSPILQLLSLIFNKLLVFLRIRRSAPGARTSLTSLLSRALVSILAGVRDLSRDAVAIIFLAGALAALRNSRGDWRSVIRAWARILAVASGIGFAREGLLAAGN